VDRQVHPTNAAITNGKEIYAEVLTSERDQDRRALDPLFAEVEQFYLAIVAREDPAKFLAEAREWLELYRKKSERYPAYQAITLEVVKSLSAMAEKASPAEKKRLSSHAGLLAGMARSQPVAGSVSTAS
jgi:hypothetical protein